jgi:hypothetical protein
METQLDGLSKFARQMASTALDDDIAAWLFRIPRLLAANILNERRGAAHR